MKKNRRRPQPVLDPLYLTARAAAAELSISPATLYAYVSRGLIRSEPIEGEARGRRYRAEDVRSLKNRRAPLVVQGEGLKASDLPIMDTTVSTITEDGPVYRGVLATALAETVTFEQAATLLWDARNNPFISANVPHISPDMRLVLDATDRAQPIDRAVAVLSLATDADPSAYNATPEGRATTGAKILRLVVAAMLRTQPKPTPIHEQIVQAWALSHPHAAELIRRVLVLLADHELNASTFTVRCAASTGISLYDAVIAGLVALKGPRHGGVGPQASRLLETLLAGDAEAIIRERVALGERFAGFGHMVYGDRDPRALSIFEGLWKAGSIDERMTMSIPHWISEATGQFPNCDYALAVMRHALNMPKGSETTIFAIARTAGWIAHATEQLKSKKPIRPRARYVGPAPAIKR